MWVLLPAINGDENGAGEGPGEGAAAGAETGARAGDGDGAYDLINTSQCAQCGWQFNNESKRNGKTEGAAARRQ